jgi:hypothetical protein
MCLFPIQQIRVEWQVILPGSKNPVGGDGAQLPETKLPRGAFQHDDIALSITT